jgi:hypothetical protein
VGLRIDRHLEGSSRGEQTRLHGPDRDAEDRREFIQRPTLEVMEDEDRSLVDVQPAKGTIQDERISICCRVDRLRRRLEVRRRDLADASPPPTSVHHSRRIDRDALQPGVELLGIPESPELAPRGDECFLRGVLRIGGFAKDRVRQPMHSIHPGTNDLLERIEVAIAGSFDERAVDRGRDGSSCGVRLSDADRWPPVHG